MYCTQCGNALPGDAKFCPKCGMEVKYFSPQGPEEDMFGFESANEDMFGFEPSTPGMGAHRGQYEAGTGERPTNWLWVLYSALICLGVSFAVAFAAAMSILLATGSISPENTIVTLSATLGGGILGPGVAAYFFSGLRVREPIVGAMFLSLLGIFTSPDFLTFLAGLAINFLLFYAGAKIGLTLKEKKLRRAAMY